MLEPKWWARRRACSVVVHTRDGRSIRGLIADITKHTVILRAAALVEADGDQPLMGEVPIPADNISFWQDLGPEVK